MHLQTLSVWHSQHLFKTQDFSFFFLKKELNIVRAEKFSEMQTMETDLVVEEK